jgi:hypothetical protein
MINELRFIRASIQFFDDLFTFREVSGDKAYDKELTGDTFALFIADLGVVLFNYATISRNRDGGICFHNSYKLLPSVENIYKAKTLRAVSLSQINKT